MYSDSKRLALSIFRQIESAILLIQEWNADIGEVDDYLHRPSGMQVLSATCNIVCCAWCMAHFLF